MKVEIKRFEHDATKANRGCIFIDNEFFGFSLERPNLDNQKSISRIPAGHYIAKKVYTDKRGYFWLIMDVPERTEIILFHSGNTMDAFEGCIGCGATLAIFPGNKRAITNTKTMCDKFMYRTKDIDEIKVIIS